MEANDLIPETHEPRRNVIPLDFSRTAVHSNLVHIWNCHLTTIRPSSHTDGSCALENRADSDVSEKESGQRKPPFGTSSKNASTVGVRLQWSQKVDKLFCTNPRPLLSQHDSVHRNVGFKPRVIFNSGNIWLIGREKDGEILRRISDLRLRDRMFGVEHSVDLDMDSLSVVKAFSKAIDRKLFTLRGEFECANAYLEAATDEMTMYKRKKPVLEANVLVPYFWARDSQIRGRLVYNFSPAGPGTRVIRVIDVQKDGELKNVVPHRAVVYLGGQHAQYVSDLFRNASNHNEKG